MEKARLNYWVDVGIAVSFVLSAVSGLVFLLPLNSDSSLSSRVLGLSYSLWNQLHIWSSLGLVAGVLAHLVLHWKWIVGMTKKMLPPREIPREEATPASGAQVTRRQFLCFGLATIAVGMVAAGYAVICGTEAAGAEQDDGSAGSSQDDLEQSSREQDDDAQSFDQVEQPEPQQIGVACPRGLVNDPYPGRCRHYTDLNGDGICDYSAPGSGNN